MHVQSLKYTVPIGAASAASPCVLTTDGTNHGLETGKVTLSGFDGDSGAAYKALNGTHTITRISDTTFSVPVDTSAEGAYSANGVEVALVNDLNNTFDAAIAITPDLFKITRPAITTASHKANIWIEAQATAATGITDIQVKIYKRPGSGMAWVLQKAFDFNDFTQTVLGAGSEDVALLENTVPIYPQLKAIVTAVGSGTNSFKFAFIQGDGLR